MRDIAGSLDCDGATHNVTIPDHADLNPGSGLWTWVFWILRRSYAINARLLDKRSGRGMMFYQPNYNYLNLWCNDGVNTAQAATAKNTPLSAWMHVAILRDVGVLRVVLDGTNAGSGVTGALGSIDIATPVSIAHVGGGSRTSCLVQDLGWYKGKALSDAEIRAIMRRNSWAAGLTSRWRCDAIVGGKLLDDVGGHDATVTVGAIDPVTVRERARTALAGKIHAVVTP